MRIVDRGAKVVVIGDDAHARIIGDLLRELLTAVRSGHTPTLKDVEYALGEARDQEVSGLGEVFGGKAPALRKDIHIRPRTRGQKRYLDTIHQSEMTLGIGPAGTGKTFLAMAAAVSALLNREVQRLILTRPAVEAGESLGFLPGDMAEKVNPYLRPLFDALFSMVDMERAQRLIEQQRIEVAPLAFMRGRTLDQAFIILDEAQNTTPDQMKMFLTRLGQGSRMVVTGDITQGDLPRGARSGLEDARNLLQNIPSIGIVYLTQKDVVRNPLVQKIINAYEGDSPEAGAASEEDDDDNNDLMMDKGLAQA